MDRFPRISVVIPSFNQARYLEQTLRSVLEQGYPDLELIVIDGGSSDGSVDIIKKYESQIAYWVSEHDGGHTEGLIKGFKRATGEIQNWVNADDLLAPQALHEVARYFSAHPQARFVYGNCTWIDRDGRPLYYRREMGFYRWLWLYAYNYIPQPAAFWRGDLYEEVGGLDPQYSLTMDADLYARFARVCKPHHLDKPLACFRVYPEQRNQAHRLKSDMQQYDILCRELNRPVGTAEKVTLGVLARLVRFGYRSVCLGAPNIGGSLRQAWASVVPHSRRMGD
jgi:glycosyltransferase involved in cell wall biosynthesis